MTVQPSAKVQVTEKPMALPGKCAICGCATRPVVDFGFNLEFYGAVLFCVECMVAVSGAIGYVPREDAEREAAQAFQKYIEANNFVVISKEDYERLAALSSAVDAYFISRVDASLAYEMDEPTDGTDSPAQSSSFDGIEPDSVEVLDIVVDKGPDIVSSSSDDGLFDDDDSI